MDRLDWVAIVGLFTVVALSPGVERPVLAAALAGLFCSVAIWRLYGGHPWETIAWLVWTVAAVALVVVPPGPVAFVVVLPILLVGAGVLFASRRSLLPPIWTKPSASD